MWSIRSAKVLISILICPTLLRFVLSRSEIEAKRCIEEAKRLGYHTACLHPA